MHEPGIEKEIQNVQVAWIWTLSDWEVKFGYVFATVIVVVFVIKVNIGNFD